MAGRRPTRLVWSAVTALVIVVTGACGAGSGPAVERSGQASIDAVLFEDVATEVGLDFRHGAFQWTTGGDPPAMMGGGVCWIDYNGDGWLDLFAVNTWSTDEFNRWANEGGPPTSRLFANDAGTFRDVTDEMGAGLAVRGNGCVAADLDGDGWDDLFVTSDRANQLLWNEGGETFTEGAAEAGVATYGWHSGAAVGDVDGDGRLDLFVAGYANMNRPIPEATRGFPNTVEPEPDLLFLNEGTGPGERPRFRDVAAETGVEADGADYGLGAILSDVDRDGDLDVFVANDTNPNRLYLNEPTTEGPGFRLIERGGAAGIDDDNAGMGVASGDYDRDDSDDLAVTNMGAQLHNIFRSNGSGPGYLDVAGDIGPDGLGAGLTGWGTAFTDVDLDSDLDLVIVHGAIPVSDLVEDREPVKVYENLLVNSGANGEPGLLRDASADVGLDEIDPYLGRGLAVADFDNDGDADLAVGTIGGDLALLRNSGAGGHWLTIAPRPATPGTVVTITGRDGTTVRRELLAGSSYLSSEDNRAHFGLGSDSTVDTVRVDWPGGTTVELDAVTGDQIVIVEPG